MHPSRTSVAFIAHSKRRDIGIYAVRNASPRGSMCFRCLMFSFPDLIFTMCYCLLDLSCGQIQGGQWRAYVGAVEESTYIVYVNVTIGA